MTKFNIYTNPQNLSAERCVAIANSFFEGKVKSSSGKPCAVILHGSPGSGKTYSLHEYVLPSLHDENAVLVAYDEYGAIDRIPEYVAEMDALKERRLDHETFYEEAKEIKGRYRQDAQYIRDLVLKRGVEEGWNLVIDTTSSSPHSLAFDQNLKDNFGYETYYVSFYAPPDVSHRRAFGRTTNPLGMDEFLKRYLALENFPVLLQQAERFDLHYNPRDGRAPLPALYKEDGKISIVPEVLALIQRDLQQEAGAKFFQKIGDGALRTKAIAQASTASGVMYAALKEITDVVRPATAPHPIP